MTVYSSRQLLTGAALATVLALAAACSGTSPSMSPTAPTASASSAAASANFSPNPVCPAGSWLDAGWSGNCLPCSEAPTHTDQGTLDAYNAACTVPPPPPETGLEGCTPGYWKGNIKKGATEWALAGYSPSGLVGSMFSAAPASFADDTLEAALSYQGGNTTDGGREILLRAAVAAVLNAANPTVDYPLTVVQIQTAVNGVVGGSDRAAMITLAGQLDNNNNLGCPLDNGGSR